MMTDDFLKKPLNEMFSRGGHKAKPQPTTEVVAIFDDVEQVVTKDRNKLWTVTLDGERYQNSILGDLILEIEGAGGTVERRAL